MISQAIEQGWMALLLGPLGALVLSLIGNWLQWQGAKHQRANAREDAMLLSKTVADNTAASLETRRVLERLEKHLDRKERPDV